MTGRRIAVIGNSHIWAMAEAHREGLSNALSGHDLRFFPQTTPLVGPLEVVDGVIIPQDKATRDAFAKSCGQDRIHLRRFDRVVIIGHHLAFRIIRDATRHFAPHDLHAGDEGMRIVSQAAFRQIVHQRLQRTLAVRLARIAWHETGVPPVLVPHPYWGWQMSERAAWSSLPPQAQALMHLRNTLFCQELAALSDLPARIVPQPPETLAELPFMTHPDYQWLNDGVPDLIHANARYGALMLPRIAAALDSISG